MTPQFSMSAGSRNKGNLRYQQWLWHLEENWVLNLAYFLLWHSHSLFHFLVLTLAENNTKKKKKGKYFVSPLSCDRQRKHCARLLWQRASGHALFEENWHKQNTHKWHRLCMAIWTHPVSVWLLVPVRQDLGAAIMGLKCEKNGQGHSPLNALLLQVKLRLFRKREPLCLINAGLISLLWS